MPDLTLQPDDRIDLQLHTIYSDGQWQPDHLFAYLAAQQFRVVAVTDHDRVDQVDALRELGAGYGVQVLAGVEVTTMWRGRPAHLLCYAQHFTGHALAELVRQTEQCQLDNTRAVYHELQRRGYAFPRRNDVLAAQGGTIVRPIDNARLLQAHRYVDDEQSALEMIRDAGYRQCAAPLDPAVAAAHASGAVTLLAHPGRGGGELHQFEPAELRGLLDTVPLDGIEVHYPTHTEAQVQAYAALARERGLLVGAGSDSHGPNQRYPVPYPASYAAALLERCGFTVLPSK